MINLLGWLSGQKEREERMRVGVDDGGKNTKTCKLLPCDRQ